MKIEKAVVSLVNYAVKEKLIEKEDVIFSVNSLLEILKLDGISEETPDENADLESLLNVILDYACENGLCENSIVYRDLFDTKIMSVFVSKPSEVIKKFREEYKISPENATKYYYHLARKSNYIREYRVKNDMKWVTKTEYGDIDITINLSKPEKDPKAIAAALKMRSSDYPKCLLCKENEGYFGRVNHPARQNHRLIPLNIGNEDWYLQYSPYVYYNEHCIVLSGEHSKMKIDRSTFKKLFDVVKYLPHYFVGSNADLPIVGGSILTHEHFQGGNYSFAMENAPVETEVKFKDYPEIEAGIVKWPMSVVRLKGDDTEKLCELSEKILNKWRTYTDKEAFIFSHTDGVPHNTITPIARKRNGKYEIDLVLRNNITTDEYPDGYYHPHPEYHHIKKENIGLIEVMGLAVLPSRLKTEMTELKKAMLSGENIRENPLIAKHADWAERIMSENTLTEENCPDILKAEIGKVFTAILSQCGVFERTEKGKMQFLRFLADI